MTYWENVLTVALGATLAFGVVDLSGRFLAVPLFAGSALLAWGLFGGIEEAVRRGRADESED
ncbi:MULTISPECIES: hypothetical protein [Halomicrobium]|uniref:Uncharacterized protein n=2 Tax=Halomicrobium mukohataei TaxID=57705 RepID=C7P2P8_HALMD|nr:MULTISPECIES: hypothetical protein [Halomicrobium]ACV47370.1 hypothetical protein Hmuk_1248 [Halomicrobium mukohataei DSM 12286]QCD65837.1 hypothetical protein E5139_09415 [Halomicrobium mukohataei]QFR20642.1 hypothetical protein GBQ70_09410 [Halomicrobium sp. ZPS1]